jgi:hypothetical protein
MTTNKSVDKFSGETQPTHEFESNHIDITADPAA